MSPVGRSKRQTALTAAMKAYLAPRPAVPSLNFATWASISTASNSRVPLSNPVPNSYSQSKGKGRDSQTPRPGPSSLSASRFSGPSLTFGITRRRLVERNTIRYFHATSRRDALPLIPAGIALFKGASLLTAVTAFSRIIISFFPIGTLAFLRIARADRWLESDAVRPSVGPESEEFYKMWCEGEQPMNLTIEESLSLIDSEPDESGRFILPGGRRVCAVPMPYPRRRRGCKDLYEPKSLMKKFHCNRNKTACMLRQNFFIVPPLPPAAERYYDSLGETEKLEVDNLRRYWTGLKRFRDCYRIGRYFVALIFGLPFALILGVYLAGLERVPLTGRWRIILLTPEEEDAISTALAGGNWYRSVINLLTTPEHPAPPILPMDDWRWGWVQGVLSRLEEAAIGDCQSTTSPGAESPLDVQLPLPLPPPTYHPFKPRPRASSLLHSVLPGGEPNTGREHLEIGPPYNIMLMKKDDPNAFSYGFGGKRAGGIVVYTGLLDDILRQHPDAPPISSSVTDGARQSILQGLFSSPRPPTTSRPQPTAEQDLHLACVLAHEMGHLLLSHHLETLSQQQVLWPSVLGFGVDLIRAFIWPFTVFLGPTVNDALANVGRTSTEELANKYGEVGFLWKHEYEADLAGLRLLARAGYDPRATLDHFQQSVAGLAEIQPADKSAGGFTGTVFKLWSKATHPSADKRMSAIRKEIDRWQEEADSKKN